MSFDGTSDDITITNSASLNFSSTMTVECWVKPNGATEQGLWLRKVVILLHLDGCLDGVMLQIQFHYTLEQQEDLKRSFC